MNNRIERGKNMSGHALDGLADVIVMCASKILAPASMRLSVDFLLKREPVVNPST